MYYKNLALASVLVAAACGSQCRDQKIAAASLGGPVGIIFAAAWQCSDDSTTQQPVAAVEAAGLQVPEQPEMGSPPDMGQAAPDLAPQPDLTPSDRDGDGVPDGKDRCPTTPSGQTPDPARLGCPAPRTYKIVLPVAAFAASGPVTVLDGTVTSKASFNWSTMKRESAALSSIFFFQNGGPNVTNAVSFELTGTADFAAPATTIRSCAAFKDHDHQDASSPNPATGNPLDVACIARRMSLCPVGIVSDQRRLFDEAACADNIVRGGGYWSASNAPVKLTESVANADWQSSDPKPVPGIEIQLLLSGNVALSNRQLVATISETLH